VVQISLLAARLDTAVHVFEAGHAKAIFVSGGTGVEGFPEGNAVREVLFFVISTD
jgi:hypothetical protein